LIKPALPGILGLRIKRRRRISGKNPQNAKTVAADFLFRGAETEPPKTQKIKNLSENPREPANIMR